MTTAGSTDELRAMVAAELRQAVPEPVAAMADALARRHPHGVAALLFYGSCLRRAEPLEGVLDFYLLVDDYRSFHGRGLAAWANAVLPPNVYYAETAWNGVTLRAKYAVIALPQFERGTARDALQSSLWARFAQPARLIAPRDASVRQRVERAVAEAVIAMVSAAVPLVGERFTSAELWETAFRATYAVELRSEGPARAAELHAADRERYDRVGALALAASGLARPAAEELDRRFDAKLGAAGRRRGRRRWLLRRPLGKTLNLLRLIKGVFTFSGGLDYILWKVERHSGVRIAVRPWQRRHPVLAAPVLAWRLYRRGGFR